MNNHNRIITELAACEHELDTVLFDTGSAVAGGTAVAGLGAGALGAAYLVGKKKLKTPVTGDLADIGGAIGEGSAKLWGNLTKWAKTGVKKVSAAVKA